MKSLLSLALLSFTLTACTPAAIEGLGRSLAQGAATSGSTPVAPKSVGVECRGTTHGTFTQAEAALSVTVTDEGEMTGTFTNNGRIFAAVGRTNVSSTNGTLFFSQVNLALDSHVSGGAGVEAKAGPWGAGVGVSAERGSNGTLTGLIDGKGLFTGTFKGLQGTYRAVLTCRGA